MRIFPPMMVFLLCVVTVVNGQTCPDGICEAGEDIGNCQQDCLVTGFEGGNFGAHYGGYGRNEWVTNNESLDAHGTIFSELDMEVARFNLFWGKLEPEKGVYNWTLVEDLLGTVDEDIEVLFTLISSSDWGSEYNDCRIEAALNFSLPDDYYFNRNPGSIPINMQDYVDFLEEIVYRYKGRVKYWQIENEVHGAQPLSEPPKCSFPQDGLLHNFWMGTMDEYIQLLAASHAKIKEADPDSVVMGSSFMKHLGNSEFTDYILEHGGDYYDIIDIHLYQIPQEDIDRVAEIKVKIQNLGYDREFWSTEHGEIDIFNHNDPQFTEYFDSPEEFKLQSEEIIKRYVLGFSAGVKKFLRLSLTYPNEALNNPEGRWEHMPLTSDKAGNEKKPSFYTNKLLIEELKDFNSVEKIDYGVYRFTFTDKDPVYVLWSDDGEKTIDLLGYVSSDNVKVTHIVTELDGNNNPIYPPNETVSTSSIQIDETPIFIEEIFDDPVCIHDADNNPCNGCIDLPELNAYLFSWKTSSSISLSDLMEAIVMWKNGC